MALPVYFSDYVQAELVAAANADQTTLIISEPTEPLPDLTVEEGAYTYLTFVDQASFIANAVPPVQREIMKLTAWETVSSGVQLTVVRGITTTAQIWAVGSIMELRPCAQALEDLKDTGGGGGAPVNATYVVMSANSTLTAERVLTQGSGITITDGGANSTVTVANAAPMVQASYVVMAASGDLTSERVLTAGSNITIVDGGANSTVTISASGGGGDGATLQSQEFTADGDFTVPANVTCVWVTLQAGGAGGGGSTTSANTGARGGGSGELVQGMPVIVVPAAVMPIVIGLGGAGGAGGSPGVVGTNGGNTTFAGYTTIGGKGAGNGGGVNGGVYTSLGNTNGALAYTGSVESVHWFGGGAGGAGGSTSGTSAAGAGSGGHATGGAGGTQIAAKYGGGGGAATIFGVGGAGGDGGTAGSSAGAGAYGCGGGGAGGFDTNDGGDGQDGYALIVWISPPP